MKFKTKMILGFGLAPICIAISFIEPWGMLVASIICGSVLLYLITHYDWLVGEDTKN